MSNSGNLKFSSLIIVTVFIAGSLLVSQSAFATPFTNGDFETPVVSGAFTNLLNGDTTIGWTVGGDSVDHIGTYWVSHTGKSSLDLSGTAAGSISQTFDTNPGTTYKVTFWMSGNPDGGTPLKQMPVTAPGYSNTFSFDTSVVGNSDADMKWVQHSFTFVATGASSTLTFTSLEDSAFGPALDDVTLEAISAVGGSGIPIDSTALLLAGIQGSALWMIPAIVVAGSGIGFISYIKSKKK